MDDVKVYTPKIDDDIIDPETIETIEDEEEDDGVTLGIPKNNKPSYEYLRAQIVIFLQKSLDSLINLLGEYQDKIEEEKIARITTNFEELMNDIKTI